jgi:hypothetical protein
MQFKVEFNFKAISTMDIVLTTGTIKTGEVFELIDAYKEGDLVFIGVKTDKGIQEAGFKPPRFTKKIEDEDGVKSFLDKFIVPYFEGTKYTIFRKKR